MPFEKKNEEHGQSMWRRRSLWMLLLLACVLSACLLIWLAEKEKRLIETQFPVEAYSTLMMLNHNALLPWICLSVVLILGLTLLVFFDRRRVRLMRSLKKTAEMYERMGRISKTFSLYILPDDTVQAASSSIFGILGYTPEEVCGKKITDFFPPGDAETLRDQSGDVLNQRDVAYTRTQTLLTKGGEVRWFVIHLVPEVMENSGQMCRHATCSDVTGAHEFEVTLQKSEQRYKALTEDISDIIWELDAETRCFVYVSSSVFQHVGVRPEEIIGIPLEKFKLPVPPGSDEKKILELIKRIQAGGTKELNALLSPRKVVYHRDGRKIYFESVYRVSKNEETGRVIIRGVSRNVTDKLRLEAYNNLSLIALQALIKPGDFNAILSDLAEDIRRETSMSSVGIRLAVGDDFPYVATAGFDEEEIKHASSLFIHQDGRILLDESGKPKLRCLCGEVLAGSNRIPWPRTAYGTVWTNDFTGSVVHISDGPPIPVCVHCGYRSMVIVPIRIGDESVGLLKLNSTAKGEFNEDIIPFIEALAFHISESMGRRKNQNYYSLLFDSMSEAVIVAERVLGPDLRLKDLFVISVNPTFQTVFGRSESDVVMKPLSEALPSVYAKVREFIGVAILEDRHVQCNYHDDVLDRDFEMTVFPVGATEFAIIASDVTEKTEVVRSLQESRRQYSTLLANISGIVYRCKYDRDWTMLFMSEGTQEVLGYTPDEFYSGKVAYNDIIDKHAREQIRENWKTALAEQALFNMEYGIVAKDGERKWVIERGAGVFDADGKLVALEGIIFDITERKHAEQDLERFATVFEQSRDAIVITNENGVILNANAAVEPLTGYGKQEIVGRVLAEFESPPIDSELYHSMWKTLYRGKTWEANFPNLRKDGTPYIENVIISPVIGKAGRVQNFVCIGRDMTQELKDEEERESLRSQLIQATKMESVGRLAGGVAHDFNNMLQAILGYAEMALMQIPSEHSAHGDIRLIQNAANRAAELTKQLLVFARRSKKNLSVFGIAEAIDDLMALLRGLIEPEARLEWTPPIAEINIKADRAQFEQAVTNICINARDAVEGKPEGVVKIRVQRLEFDNPYITFTGTVPPGTYASITIEDNGHGVSEEDLPQMFDPFFTTKAKGKGTGLGLATVYGIVKSCGGGILVQSEPDKGTTVELLFPESNEEILMSDAASLSEPSTQPLPRGSGETVLLVDDEETILLTTRRMLESIGYNVVATSSSLEAITLAKAKGESISLLLTDVIMPELNGPQMVKRILEFLPDLPYLYMSGYTANLLADHGVPKRSIGNIYKPFTRAMLAEKIRKGLNRAEKG